jgi:hypothetical protein
MIKPVAGFPIVMRIQVLPATRDQLIVTHSRKVRDLPAVRASKGFSRVTASRRRLSDQSDFLRLDPFHFFMLPFLSNSLLELCQLIFFKHDADRASPICTDESPDGR